MTEDQTDEKIEIDPEALTEEQSLMLSAEAIMESAQQIAKQGFRHPDHRANQPPFTVEPHVAGASKISSSTGVNVIPRMAAWVELDTTPMFMNPVAALALAHELNLLALKELIDGDEENDDAAEAGSETETEGGEA